MTAPTCQWPKIARRRRVTPDGHPTEPGSMNSMATVAPTPHPVPPHEGGGDAGVNAIGDRGSACSAVAAGIRATRPGPRRAKGDGRCLRLLDRLPFLRSRQAGLACWHCALSLDQPVPTWSESALATFLCAEREKLSDRRREHHIAACTALEPPPPRGEGWGGGCEPAVPEEPRSGLAAGFREAIR
jgi:hypothetical protein